MFEGKRQFRRHPTVLTGCKCRTVGLAHESAIGAGNIPAPMLRRRSPSKCGFGHDAFKASGELGDQPAVGDDRLDRSVGALRGHRDVLLVGRTGQLVFKCKGGRCRHTIRRQRRQLELDDAHA